MITYTVLSDTLASVLIPMMVPFVNPGANAGFFVTFWGVIKEVFSILVLPTLLAWLIRYAFPSLLRLRFAQTPLDQQEVCVLIMGAQEQTLYFYPLPSFLRHKTSSVSG